MSDLLQLVPTGTPGQLRLVGELDASNVDWLIEGLKQEVSEGTDLFLDLSELSFVDSMGLRGFLRLASWLEGQAKLVLASPQRTVSRTMELVGLDRLPKIAIVQAEAAAVDEGAPG